MPIVHLPDIPWEVQHSPQHTFASACRNVSIALGGIRNAGTWGGGHPFDFQMRRVPPGAAVCPFHAHLAQWEMFLIRSGRGLVRAGSARHEIFVGDVFVHPPGGAHQLINNSDTDLEVFIFADNPPLDACHYPDSNKWGLRPPGKFFRIAETGYFDGEESPVEGAPPYQPASAPPAPSLVPFEQRRLNIAALPWESWQSPKGKFRGASKELSIALGALRNQPSGLGGHPFDLELAKLEAGSSGCVYHSHAAQWEMFIILNGAGTVRVGDRRIAVSAGDVILHPPLEAHQLINTGSDEMEYLLVADNPPVDIFHYPDSQKTGITSPRRFFRAAECDYWEGEE